MLSVIKLGLGAFFTSSSGAIARIVLASLGMGIISFAAVATSLNAVIQSAQSSYSSLGGYLSAFAGIAGLGEAFGIIVGAMIFRVSVTSLSRLGVLKK